MKKILVIARVIGSLLVAGALVNFLVAQAAGWWVTTRPDEGQWLYVPVGDEAAEVRDERGFGKRCLSWRTMPPSWAATWQQLHAGTTPVAKLDAPRWDPVPAVPGWCSAWQEARRRDAAAVIETAIASAGLTNRPTDAAVGWPCLSFAARFDGRVLDASAPEPARVVAWGCAPQDSGSRFKDGEHVLAWRPLFPGVVAGSLSWAIAIAALLQAQRLTRRTIRTRRGTA